MRDRLKQWMAGRNGGDALSFSALIAYLAVSFVGSFTHLRLLQILAFLLIIYALYRVFSRDVESRRRENSAYMQFLWRIKDSGRARKERKNDQTHVYVRCKKCGSWLRLPRGVGKVEASCPKCGSKRSVKT